MAKVLLAKARYTTRELRSLVPPLGLMYIASVLREAGHFVRIYDPGKSWKNITRFSHEVMAFRPDVVGISAITLEARTAFAMAAATRAVNPNIPVVLGGPHATSYPERCLENPAIDYLVIGEGEQTMLDLVNVLTRGGQPQAVPGVVSRGPDGRIVFGPARQPLEDLDAIPFPAWDLVDLDYYARFPSMSTMGPRRYMTLFTSRGCPYRCIYCHNVMGKRFRSRSPKNVVAEIEALYRRFGIQDFEIVDDIFNFNRERMLEILDGIISLPFRCTLHFPNGLRTDKLDDYQIMMLKRAGTQFLCVAVESAVPRIQRLIGKNLRLEAVRENIEIAVKRGMFVSGFFMLGFPTETAEEARATVDFACKSSLHQALFFIVTPFEGTALFDRYRDLIVQRNKGLRFENLEYYNCPINLSAMPDDELFRIKRLAYFRFYSDPRRIFRILANHPRRSYLLTAGFQVLLKMLPRHPGSTGWRLLFS